MIKSLLIVTMFSGSIVTTKLKVDYKGCKKIAKMFKKNKDIKSVKCKKVRK